MCISAANAAPGVVVLNVIVARSQVRSSIPGTRASQSRSIGVAVRRWVNLHGIAINVAMDLEPWQRVRPCGLDPAVIGVV